MLNGAGQTLPHTFLYRYITQRGKTWVWGVHLCHKLSSPLVFHPVCPYPLDPPSQSGVSASLLFGALQQILLPSLSWDQEMLQHNCFPSCTSLKLALGFPDALGESWLTNTSNSVVLLGLTSPVRYLLQHTGWTSGQTGKISEVLLLTDFTLLHPLGCQISSL